MINYLISGISAIFALLSVIITYYVYRSSSLAASYLDVDKQYSDLLKLSLDDPDLRNYEITSTYYKLDPQEPFRKKYEIYANLCWNLVETIYDHQKDKTGTLKLSETWLPIMIEENRLHYAWFKRNLRLFKAEFQNFVVEELNDIEIAVGTVHDLPEIYRKFVEDFVSDERKSYEQLEVLMAKGKYKLLLAQHKISHDSIGYAFIYEIFGGKALWLDYIAIDPRFQNSGYGTLFFNKIISRKGKPLIGIFMEVEMADSIDDKVKTQQLRRLKFYDKLGAQKLHVDYRLPTKTGSLPMHLFFKPSPDTHVLYKEQIKEAIISVFEYIHSDIDHKDKILTKVSPSIIDEYFD